MSEYLYTNVINADTDLKSLLQLSLDNPEKELVFDCSFEANPFWHDQAVNHSEMNKPYWQEVQNLNNRITQADIKVKIITGRYDLQMISQGNNTPDTLPPERDYVCWQTRFFHETILENRNLVESNPQPGTPLNFNLPESLFVSLMHYPKIHRVALMEVLMENGVMDKGIVRFCNNTRSWRNLIDPKTLPYYSEFLEKLLQHAPNIFSPYKYQTEGVVEVGLNLDPFYSYGFFDLPAESHCDLNFITQKSCQPILWKKPFCVIGSTQQNMLLKNLGFELFDEVFDLSCETQGLVSFGRGINKYNDSDYTYIKCHYDKVLKNLWLIDNSQESIRDMREKFSDKIEHNLNRYVQILFDDDMLPEYQEVRNSFLITESRRLACINPYLQKYVPG